MGLLGELIYLDVLSNDVNDNFFFINMKGKNFFFIICLNIVY